MTQVFYIENRIADIKNNETVNERNQLDLAIENFQLVE